MADTQDTSASRDRHSGGNAAAARANPFLEMKAHARVTKSKFTWDEIRDHGGNVVEVIAFTEHPEGIKELIEFLEAHIEDGKSEAAVA